MPHWYWETMGVLLALQVLWASGLVVSMLRRIAVAQEAQAEALGTVADSLVSETERAARKTLAGLLGDEQEQLEAAEAAEVEAAADREIRRQHALRALCFQCGSQMQRCRCPKAG